MNQVIVIKRDRKASAIYFALTLAMLGIAGFVAYAGNASVAALLGIVGLPALYSTTRNTLRNPPLLRADAAGLWFGGGRTVGWREVKMIGEGLNNNSGGGTGVAVHFHQRKTLLRLPFSRLARLEALAISMFQPLPKRNTRGLSLLGSEGGVVAGTFALPAARVRQNKRNPT